MVHLPLTNAFERSTYRYFFCVYGAVDLPLTFSGPLTADECFRAVHLPLLFLCLWSGRPTADLFRAAHLPLQLCVSMYTYALPLTNVFERTTDRYFFVFMERSTYR